MPNTNIIWSRKFTLMIVSNFLTSVAFYFMLTSLPLYLTSYLHFDKDDAGLIISAYIFTAVVVRPFVGVLIDKYGRKIIYLSSLSIFSLLFVLYGIFNDAISLTIIRIAHGIVWGVLTTAGSTIILDIVPQEKRGEGIGYYGLAFTLAMAIGPFLASLIIKTENYKLLFILSTVIALIGTSLLLGLKLPKHNSINTKIIDGLKGFISPVTFPIAILTILIMMPYGAILNFIAIYCNQVKTGDTGIFFISLAIALTISRIGAGKIFDRDGPKKLIIISYIFIILSFPALIVFDSPITLMLSALFIGFGFGISFPIYQLMINNILPIEMRGTANSIFLTALDLGIGLGTLIMGFLTQNINLKLAFLVWIIIGVFSLVMFLSYVSNHYKINDLSKKIEK